MISDLLDAMQNIPHNDLTAWIFWVVLMLIAAQIFQAILLTTIFMRLSKDKKKQKKQPKKPKQPKKEKADKSPEKEKTKPAEPVEDAPQIFF